MFDGVPLAHNRMSLICKVATIVEMAFDKSRMALAMPIYIFPCLCAVE